MFDIFMFVKFFYIYPVSVHLVSQTPIHPCSFHPDQQQRIKVSIIQTVSLTNKHVFRALLKDATELDDLTVPQLT